MEYINKTNFTDQTSFWDFKGTSESVDTWFLMNSPLPLMAITTSYLLFVLKVGPNAMKHKPPMNLKNTLVLYNVMQVICSIYLVKLGFQLLGPNGLLNSNCAMKSNLLPSVTKGIYYYLLAKITELLDTVFFILRKKQNQVTFLHVYHHSAMLWNTWLSLKYDPTYTLVFLGTINSLVHVIMYAYYMLSAFPSLAKYLWWKKYLTSLQLVQFIMVLIHTIANHYYGCPMTYLTLFLVLFNGSFFILLFGDFYVRSYTKGLSPINSKQKDKNKCM